MKKRDITTATTEKQGSSKTNKYYLTIKEDTPVICNNMNGS